MNLDVHPLLARSTRQGRFVLALLLCAVPSPGAVLPQESTAQTGPDASSEFQRPETVEEALVVPRAELEAALADSSPDELEPLLAGWLTLVEQQEAAFQRARTEEPEELSAIAQLAVDLDLLTQQAEWILTAFEPGGEVADRARAKIEALREQALRDGSGTTVPLLQATALELDKEVLKALLRPMVLEQAEQQMALWLERLQGKCIEVRNAEIAGLLAEDSGRVERDSALAVQARAERAQLIDRVNVVIDAVEKKGGDVGEARAYVSSVVVPPRITGLRAAWTTALAWMTNPDSGIALAKHLALAIVVLVASWMVAGLVASLAARAMSRIAHTSELLRKFVATSVRRVVVLLGVIVALGQLGVDMAPWLAAIGAAGLVVGLALQGTLSNFASGIMIMIYRPFDVGDVIATAGPTGKVQGMTLVTTTVKTFDNQTVHIPNNMVWGDVITNITANETRRVDMVFGVGYQSDLRQAKDLLLELAQGHAKVLSDPPTNVQVSELADSSVNLIVRPWVRTEDYWDVYWDLTQAVKERFDQEGISIPFPQRDVHLVTASAHAEEQHDSTRPAAASAPSAAEPGPADEPESPPNAAPTA